MAHIHTDSAESLLDQEIKVLDKGFVRMVDYMGSDSRIVQSARVSYGAGTKTVRQDRGLIHYLMKHRHTSPFEQVHFTFHCKMPIFVARQWVRHRTAKLNEISARYSVMADEFYLPDPEKVAVQSASNKQGRGDSVPLEAAMAIIRAMEAGQRESYSQYEQLIEQGVARELARTVLPVSLYTEWYWTIDLHNLFHFLALRMDAHAQYEIRVFAEAMAQCVKAVVPLAYDAFEEHMLGSVTFSKAECEALAAMLTGGQPTLEGRPLAQFEEKIAKLRAAQAAETPEEPILPA